MSAFPDMLVVATHNEGKAREISALLAPLGIRVLSAASIGLPEPVENGESFAANALIKSESAAMLSGNWALADDSGLCVDALGSEPGIYSARWAGETKDFKVAGERIHAELLARKANPQGAAAHFICVLALTSPNGESKTFEGRVDGTLTFPPRGAKGFGYDPIFVPQGRDVTFAEMDPNSKQEISHRTKAFTQFVSHMQAQVKKGVS